MRDWGTHHRVHQTKRQAQQAQQPNHAQTAPPLPAAFRARCAPAAQSWTTGCMRQECERAEMVNSRAGRSVRAPAPQTSWRCRFPGGARAHAANATGGMQAPGCKPCLPGEEAEGEAEGHELGQPEGHGIGIPHARVQRAQRTPHNVHGAQHLQAWQARRRLVP